ncbi:MAG: nucleolar RNA-binding Nop10p family protein [Promethearchaeota archaeon]
MTKYLLKCKNCKNYGLYNPELKCKHCGGELVNPRPPRFSPVDKYAKYRIEYFKEEFKKRFFKD